MRLLFLQSKLTLDTNSDGMKRALMLTVVWLLASCVGTDVIDDPIVGESIEVSHDRIALMTGDSFQLSATYYDQYGLPTGTKVDWRTSDASVATVNEDGLVQGVFAGQAMVVAYVGALESLAVDVNVVADDQQVAVVEIINQSPMASLMIGETLQLEAEIKNIKGEILTGKTLEWFSENSGIASVSATGLVTGVSSGLADVHAKSEGVKSNVIHVSVGGGKSGTFVSSGGYTAKGMATLQVVSGKLILTFSNDFETSFALGTYVYMANTTNGSMVASSGLEVAQITTNGAKTFDLTSIDPDIGIDDYAYVIILCKPARVTFGYAQMN